MRQRQPTRSSRDIERVPAPCVAAEPYWIDPAMYGRLRRPIWPVNPLGPPAPRAIWADARRNGWRLRAAAEMVGSAVVSAGG